VHAASIVSQLSICTAAVTILLRGCLAPLPLLPLMEVCSVYAHRPADRTMLQELLRQVQPGGCIVISCPGRLACKPGYLTKTIQQLRAEL
jgi:hypothetical protein